MRFWKLGLLLAVVAMLGACNLSTSPPSVDPLEPSAVPPGGKPTVTISSPQSGEEVVVGEDIFVTATATDSAGVTRVQLVANNQIVKTVSSDSLSGDRTMNVVLDYRPTTTGNLTLNVVAFRGAVASDPASVTVTVRSTQAQVTATVIPPTNAPIIDPNDRTCRALTNVSLNVRSGPGTEFNRLTTLNAGTVVPIIGRTPNNAWWLVRVNNSISGWIAQADPGNPNNIFITIYGVCTGVPIINPPTATWTPRPPVTATFVPTWTPLPPPTATTIPLPPDLVIASITGPESVVIPAGETSVSEMYQVVISNTGGSNTGRFNNTLAIAPPGGAPQDLGVVADLGPQESISLSITVVFTAPGDYILTARADSDAEVEELSEVNNTGTISVAVTSGS